LGDGDKVRHSLSATEQPSLSPLGLMAWRQDAAATVGLAWRLEATATGGIGLAAGSHRH